jgi:predicted nucleic acid-binding Zn ribbon protein
VTTWRPLRPDAGERQPRRVGESLDRITRTLGTPRAQVLATVFSSWEELVGPDIAAHTQPRSLRDGVLVIAADQPAWVTQLRFLAADLLARIQAATDGADVREIRLTVATPEPSRRGRRVRNSEAG